MQTLASHLGVTMFIKNQDGDRPANAVYGEYEVFNTDYANPNQWVRSQKELEDNWIEVTTVGSAVYSIQCNFLYDGTITDTYDALLDKVDNAWIWLCYEGKELLGDNNFVVTNISKDIQRHYDHETTAQVMKAGFDFHINGKLTKVRTIERIIGVDADGQPQN